jgi:hypothetical protein
LSGAIGESLAWQGVVAPAALIRPRRQNGPRSLSVPQPRDARFPPNPAPSAKMDKPWESNE